MIEKEKKKKMVGLNISKTLIKNLLQQNKFDLIFKKLKENKSFIKDAIQNSSTINKRRI